MSTRTPVICENANEVAAAAFDSDRKRPVVAKNEQGQTVVCSRRTAARHGWTVEETLFERQRREAAAAKKTPRKTRKDRRADAVQNANGGAPAHPMRRATDRLDAALLHQLQPLALAVGLARLAELGAVPGAVVPPVQAAPAAKRAAPAKKADRPAAQNTPRSRGSRK